MEVPPLANRLADYACRLRFDDLPAAAVHEAKRRFIDSIATAVGAMSAEAYAIAKRCALRVQGQPGAGLFGGGRSSVEWATFVNGLLIRYLDYNDTYLSLEPAHPSDNLAPVLAVGDSVQASGRELITAAVLAYEIQCRLCDAASLRKHGVDHVTYGAISSAVAASRAANEPLRAALAKAQPFHMLNSPLRVCRRATLQTPAMPTACVALTASRRSSLQVARAEEMAP